MDKNKIKIEHRVRRHRRIRAKVKGTMERPRLSVFRSNAYIYAQLIDDIAGVTLVSTASLKGRADKKVVAAAQVGKKLAAAARERGITKVVFDRGGYVYTGRVKALAEGAREGGLAF